MKQKLQVFLMMFCMALSLNAFAQSERVIKGQVTSTEDGSGLPGVNVIVKGTTTGTATDFDGNFSIKVGAEATVLQFTGVGLSDQEVTIGNQSVINLKMGEDIEQMEAVVVTALGVSREKKSLGDAVQSVGAEEINTVKQPSIANALSGKVSGLQIRASDNIGGSTNIVIRGQSSINNNQALFVVDGVPMNNSSNNSADQNRGGGGYDWGSPMSDINPDDIESVSVLKGASAAALYGSRGANGVILVTTKKGTSRKGVGVSVSTGVTFQTINESTLPNYQRQYGSGYGDYYGPNYDAHFNQADLNGDGKPELLVPYGEDASFGAKFNPNLNVVHWDATDPNRKDPAIWGDKAYGATRPWIAPETGVEGFFETGRTLNNNVTLSGGSDKGTYRFSYTNAHTKGVIPNSEIASNTFNINASWNLSDKLSSSVTATYLNTGAKNRPGQGYDYEKSRAFMAHAAFWMQTNVDYDRLKNYVMEDGTQYTWNKNSHDDHSPHYWDNPYWTVYKNFPEDTRDRIFGNWKVDYKITDWLTATSRLSYDYYTFKREERIAAGSYYPEAFYSKDVITNEEYNIDFFLKANKNIGEDFSLAATLGSNYRANNYDNVQISTNQGFKIPGIDWVENSKNAQIGVSDEYTAERNMGYIATASIGYKDILFLDGNGRIEKSSTLKDTWLSYGGLSSSFIFSDLPALENSKILSFGKLRASFGKVGQAASPFRLKDLYSIGDYDGNLVLENDGYKKNPELRPETTTSWEIGTELNFFQNRIRTEVTYYEKSTIDQIIAKDIVNSTGWYKKWANIGEVTNKGVELTLSGTPVKDWNGFTWDITVNWAKNINKVVDLDGDASTNEYSHLFNRYFVNVVAKEGEPMGALIGTNYVYDENGNKVIGSNGRYEKTTDFEVLGNSNPDWTGGLRNSFTYKGIRLSALIDASVGGERFSVTKYWGRSTGILEETVGNNDLGNPKRNAIKDEDGNLLPESVRGGVILDGVTEDGKANEKRISAYTSFQSWANPHASGIVDATYVKLREVSLGYTLPSQLTKKTPFSNVTLSFVGSNLAILVGPDDFDAEQTYGAGNVQGLEVGTLPSTRRYGFNLKFNF